MMPTPAPAPPMPMQAIPAPMYFAAIGSMRRTPFRGLVRRAGSVARMDSIVEIDAGEDGEDIGLQKRDQQLERGQRDGQPERQYGAGPAENSQGAEHADKAREHFQRDVACQHVREKPYRMRNGLQEERYDLDEYHQRQDVDRNTRRHEQLEKFQAVLVEAVKQHDEEHQQRQRYGDDEMAGNRERVRNDPDQVGNADEHEQREHQREELHALRPGGASDGGRHEFVAQFSDRLNAAGNKLPPGGAADHQQRDHRYRKKHVGGRIGERYFLSADVTDGEELDDLELMNWIGGHSSLGLSVSRSLADRVERSVALRNARVRAVRTASPSRPPPASH